jgi:hypothetical protein
VASTPGLSQTNESMKSARRGSWGWDTKRRASRGELSFRWSESGSQEHAVVFWHHGTFDASRYNIMTSFSLIRL